jgi:serine/threonine-protein kinase HipA
VFNLLITNIDDHLHNLGFLHIRHDQWRLAPAFDVNPFPDKDQELRTWLSEDIGPVSSIDEVLGAAAYFRLKPDQALRILGEVHSGIRRWRDVATTPSVGMLPGDLTDFAPAFEHAQMKRAALLLS